MARATYQQSTFRQVLPLALLAMASPVAMGLVVPALPNMGADLSVSDRHIQWVVTGFLMTIALGQLIYGKLADSWGRRPALILGMVLFTIGSAATVFAPDANSLIAARMLQALGTCAGMAIARTMVIDIYGRRTGGGMLGYIVSVMAIAPAVAPLIGGWITDHYHWRLALVLALVFSLLTLLVALTRPETRPAPGNHDMPDPGKSQSWLPGFTQLWRNHAFKHYTLNATCLSVAFFAFIGTAPFILANELQVPAAEYGRWYLLVAAGTAAGSFTTGRLSERLGGDRLITLGNGFSLLGGVLMMASLLLLPLSLPTLFLPMVLVVFGRGISQSQCVAAAIAATPGSAGNASGSLGFIQLMVGALGTQLSLLLAQIDLLAFATLMLLMPLVSLLLQQRYVHMGSDQAQGRPPYSE